MNLYKLFSKTKHLAEKTDYVKIYNLSHNSKNYKIIITKKAANRHSIIHCKDDCIFWEQAPLIPRLEGRSFGIETPIYKFEKSKNETVIFTVKGKPNGITGLDDGIFRSANRFDDNYINVMTYKRFKTL